MTYKLIIFFYTVVLALCTMGVTVCEVPRYVIETPASFYWPIEPWNGYARQGQEKT